MEAGAMTCKSLKTGIQLFDYWTMKRKCLKLRKMPGNGRNIATEEEVFQIKHEFLPGGQGWWEPGVARFLPDGTLKEEVLREQNEQFELVLPENPVEQTYGS